MQEYNILKTQNKEVIRKQYYHYVFIAEPIRSLASCALSLYVINID